MTYIIQLDVFTIGFPVVLKIAIERNIVTTKTLINNYTTFINAIIRQNPGYGMDAHSLSGCYFDKMLTTLKSIVRFVYGNDRFHIHFCFSKLKAK